VSGISRTQDPGKSFARLEQEPVGFAREEAVSPARVAGDVVNFRKKRFADPWSLRLARRGVVKVHHEDLASTMAPSRAIQKI